MDYDDEHQSGVWEWRPPKAEIGPMRLGEASLNGRPLLTPENCLPVSLQREVELFPMASLGKLQVS